MYSSDQSKADRTLLTMTVLVLLILLIYRWHFNSMHSFTQMQKLWGDAWFLSFINSA